MPIFTGFASGQTGSVQVIHDIELIKQDLLNQFNTMKGERLMDTEYGFIGWDLIFDLKQSGTKEMIESDCRRIVQSDPRVTEQSIEIIEEEHGFTVSIELIFNEFATADTLVLFFDQAALDSQV